ncbi:unnamed protein product [Prunus armeniaca]
MTSHVGRNKTLIPLLLTDLTAIIILLIFKELIHFVTYIDFQTYTEVHVVAMKSYVILCALQRKRLFLDGSIKCRIVVIKSRLKICTNFVREIERKKKYFSLFAKIEQNT